jgi:hypothetical protein
VPRSHGLPDFMVPPVLIPILEMPLTPNGKVNRQELDTQPRRESSQAEPSAAGDVVEREILDICGEVLEIRRGEAFDNFFDLGGHSLHATAIVARIRARFGLVVPFRTIFEAATLGDFAKTVGGLLSAPPERPKARAAPDRNLRS